MKQYIKFLILFLLISSFIPCKAESEAYMLLQRAVKKHKRHQIESALIDYDRALTLEPEWIEIYYSRGLARNEIGDYEGGLRDFTKAIELDPENDSAYFNRGISKYELKMYKAAIRDFDRAIELLPGDAKSFWNRALTKYALNDTKGALRDARQAQKFFKALNKKVEYSEVTDFINSIREGDSYAREYNY